MNSLIRNTCWQYPRQRQVSRYNEVLTHEIIIYRSNSLLSSLCSDCFVPCDWPLMRLRSVLFFNSRDTGTIMRELLLTRGSFRWILFTYCTCTYKLSPTSFHWLLCKIQTAPQSDGFDLTVKTRHTKHRSANPTGGCHKQALFWSPIWHNCGQNKKASQGYPRN